MSSMEEKTQEEQGQASESLQGAKSPKHSPNDPQSPKGQEGNASPPLIEVKLVLLGDSCVGKSSFIARFVKNVFEEKDPTIGAAFYSQKMEYPDKIIKLNIWDTAGQERFNSLTPMYYRNAKAVIVAYDINKNATLKKAKSWIETLRKREDMNILITLIGTKLDLAAESREVEYEEAAAYAKSVSASFFETSSKTGENIGDVFLDIGNRISPEDIISQTQKGNNGWNNPGNANVNLNFSGSAEQDNKCFC